MLPLILILLSALILRLILAPLGFHIDILSNAGWGQWIYENGTKGFYDNNQWIYAWPTQPPFVSLIYGFDRWLYEALLETFRWIGNTIVQYRLAPSYMIWWFEFTKWFDTGKLSPEAVFSTGYLTTIKILPILADLGIGAFIYVLAKKIKTIKRPLVWVLIYLFSPFSFYLSALWGQYDQLSFLPMILAFFLESKRKYPWLSVILFSLSVAIKPTSLILLPFYIYLYLQNKHKKKNLIISLSAILIFSIFSILIFSNKNIFMASYEIFEKIFLKSATRLSANAFNFWRLLQSYSIQTQESKVLFIPAYIWSLMFYLTLNFIAVKKLKEINPKNVFVGVFIIAAGSWLFMTNMLDRYFFAGIVSGLLVVMHYPKLFIYWFLMSLIFAVNLFNQWWFPESFNLLRSILEWNGAIITKGLSLINILLFLKITRRLVYN